MAVTGQSEDDRSTGPTKGSTARRAYLAAEYVGVFFVLVIIYTAYWRGTSPIPVLVALAAVILVYLLRSPGYDRGSLWRASALPSQLPSIAGLWARRSLPCRGGRGGG
ncbi:MAG TPA: hypothetical protein VK735_15650 [Pseudonocardia sp.]|jgi:hypothetical protein|uniref:hypothetical protein n=1 Tax=Pseudonocardia sp. TaxID=60912 RepID=UPI002CB80733|nr:hypothetical protein [Pseudonocardia sp.]HTF48879.1 hypothetical protein [Pseudonocardia sp.]